MRKPVLMGSVAGCAVATALGGAAASQDESYFIRDRNVSVTERIQTENRSDGIRSGQFLLRPQLDLGVGWTSNVFNLSDTDLPGLEFVEDESAVFGFLRASVAGVSDWSRHEVRFDGYVEVTENERFSSEGFVTAGASLGGVLDIGRFTEAFGAVSFDHLREGRQVNNTFLVAEEPVQYDVARAELGLRREAGRLRTQVRLDLADYDFDDVTIVPIPALDRLPDGTVVPILDGAGAQAFVPQGTGDQDFRDHVAYRGTVEAAVAVSADTALVAKGQIERREFDGRDAFGLDRDSDGFRVAVGAEFDLTRLVRGEFTVGYFERAFEDPVFEDVSGLGLDAGIEWFATALTTVTLAATRDVEDSPFVGSGGVVREEASVRIDHELRRHVGLYAYAAVGQDAFDEVDREFDRFRAGVGGRYHISDHLSVAASYDYLEQELADDGILSAFGAPYDTHQALITITLAP